MAVGARRGGEVDCWMSIRAYSASSHCTHLDENSLILIPRNGQRREEDFRAGSNFHFRLCEGEMARFMMMVSILTRSLPPICQHLVHPLLCLSTTCEAKSSNVMAAVSVARTHER